MEAAEEGGRGWGMTEEEWKICDALESTAEELKNSPRLHRMGLALHYCLDGLPVLRQEAYQMPIRIIERILDSTLADDALGEECLKAQSWRTEKDPTLRLLYE